MSDISIPIDDDGQADTPAISELRAAAARGTEATAENARLARELAFVKAGIDTDAGVGKLLLESYRGEPTKDAVLAAAAEYGIAPQANEPPAPAEPVVTPEDAELARARAALAAGSEIPTGAVDVDPHVHGISEFHRLRATGQRAEDASAGYFDTVLAAANAGDERVLGKRG